MEMKHEDQVARLCGEISTLREKLAAAELRVQHTEEQRDLWHRKACEDAGQLAALREKLAAAEKERDELKAGRVAYYREVIREGEDLIARAEAAEAQLAAAREAASIYSKASDAATARAEAAEKRAEEVEVRVGACAESRRSIIELWEQQKSRIAELGGALREVEPVLAHLADADTIDDTVDAMIDSVLVKVRTLLARPGGEEKEAARG